MTKIVNLRQEPYDIYIGRAGKGFDGYFGNPYRVGDICMRCGVRHTNGGDTLPCFKLYFYERLKRDISFKQRIKSLKDKVLGCFCKPGPCHGDIIIEYLEQDIT